MWESSCTSELQQRDMGADMSAAVAATLENYHAKFLNGEVIKTWWRFSPKFKTKQAMCHFSGFPLPDGTIAMLVQVLGHESTMRRELAAVDCTNLSLLFSEQGDLLSANQAFTEKFGDELKNLTQFLGNRDKQRALISSVKKHIKVKLELECHTGSKKVWFRIEPIWQEDTSQLLLQLTDSTAQKKRFFQEQYNAEHDDLTQTYNRRGGIKQIQNLCNTQQAFSLFFLDIDGFKLINDTYGHSTGDQVLISVANRLLNTLSKDCVLARFGGDEFIILLSEKNYSPPDDFAASITHILTQPFYIDGIDQLSLSCSIGYSSFPLDTVDPEELIAQADMAMHHAKERGINQYQHFSEDIANALFLKTHIRQRLSQAIDNNSLQLYFQPIIATDTLVVVGFEALLRWNDAELGQVSPAEFIPIAEESGQILSIGQWVLAESIKQLRKWHRHYDPSLTMSINLSRKQLDKSLPKQVKLLCDKYQVPPKHIALEITESALMQNYKVGLKCLYELAAIGVHLYLDDFGTGYSSLGQLQNLPISTVKLDQSFVQSTEDGSHAIVEATKAICEKMGLTLVAEGVEEQGQLSYLQECKYEFAQGFLFSKPLPAEQIEEKILMQKV
ncbi:bifunctional diguanylate cyclase/phosphodiesterase [Shewanella sp. UCD-KL12]|uniref:putative bifunctional diguanylate cyclase/phosphodiesterase n=1 Tax=Shewanella sp. UCD-KL12 TaxID=1917163 RepID=UPI0009F90A6F|nr:EAL domain-containing protein [Shewanella sp. UCD-KL12]